MKNYERETKVLYPILATRDGIPTTGSVEYAILPKAQRPEDNPTAWVPPATLEGKSGIMLESLTPGFYRIWARITTTAEAPVYVVDTIEIL